MAWRKNIFYSGISTKNCFTDASKSIVSGEGKKEFVKDYQLNRYACYLIAQNGDPRKEVIALAQTYFAVPTRTQEIPAKEKRYLTGDEELQRIEDLRQKAIWDENSLKAELEEEKGKVEAELKEIKEEIHSVNFFFFIYWIIF